MTRRLRTARQFLKKSQNTNANGNLKIYNNCYEYLQRRYGSMIYETRSGHYEKEIFSERKTLEIKNMIAQTIGRYTQGNPLENRIETREENKKYEIKRKRDPSRMF